MMLQFCGVYENCLKIPSRCSDAVWFNSYSIVIQQLLKVNSPKFGEYTPQNGKLSVPVPNPSETSSLKMMES